MENKLSVSQLNNYIKGIFDDELVLQKIYVYGEVYEFTVSNGITYITLKENDCYINCVKYSKVEKIEIGTAVTLFGSVSYYRKAGRVSFSILSIQKTGEGKYYQEFLELKSKLSAEGLFVNKCKLPQFVTSVAIVTSSTGAVIHDFLSVLADKHPYVSVNLFRSRVQGEGAANELCQALLDAGESKCDLVVIARGGGSASDLNCFNDESVVRTIAGLTVPTISAVGHETDYTLCDLASTFRAGTPSIAAGTIADINDDTTNRFYELVNEIKSKMQDKATTLYSRMYRAVSQLSINATRVLDFYRFRILKVTDKAKGKATSAIDNRINFIRSAIGQIASVADKKLNDGENRLAVACTALEGKNPLKILSLGYAKIQKDGADITKSAQLNDGDVISMRFSDGRVEAVVREK